MGCKVSWERTERTLKQIQRALVAAETEEQCQAIGALGRDALISLAQAVYRPHVHHLTTDAIPSATDAKRRLEEYVAVTFPGGTNEQARAFIRSAIQLADALTHKRTATSRDAMLVAIATDSAVKLLAASADHVLAGAETDWRGVYVGARYFAWDGPQLHALLDRAPIPAPQGAIDALGSAGHTPSFGTRAKLRQHQAKGCLQVFETDRDSWRKELLHDADGDQVLLVRPGPGLA